MAYFYSFTQIPILAWLILIGLSLSLLATIAISRHRRAKSSQITPNKQSEPKWKRITIKILRLTIFGIFSFLLISAILMFVLNYQSVIQDTAPSPSQVEIPNDLPFEVEEVTFLSEDGIQIAGWYIPSKNGVTIILLHGYSNNRLGMRWHAERLIEADYGVLMYDERASGESGGKYRSYGWEDERDVGGAIAYLNQPTRGKLWKNRDWRLFYWRSDCRPGSGLPPRNWRSLGRWHLGDQGDRSCSTQKFADAAGYHGQLYNRLEFSALSRD